MFGFNKIISSLEEVSLDDLNIKGIARIDTGAYYNVIHCDRITRTKKKIIFEPFGSDCAFEMHHFKKVKITSSNGLSEYRYIVELLTTLGKDSSYASTCLTNRDNMKYGILIGRKFLAEHDLLVSSK
jgi:hypothetical protein